MDKNLKVMNRELREGKNLEENLPGFLNKMAGVYHRYAMLELAMRYPTYYEAIRDGEITPAEEDWKLVDALNVLIRENLKEKFDGEGEKASIIAVNDIRKKAVRRMSVLTAYTDRLSLKEYILNRLEYCYKEIPEYEEDDDAAREILRVIFETDDNAIVNEKIRMMLSQLPVRMTKTKFFEYLEQSFQNYAGQDREAVDSFLYMLRSAAGIYEPEGFDEEYPNLKELMKQLDQKNYSELSEEEYEECCRLAGEGTDFLNNTADVYFGLQELVNCLYAALLLNPYAMPAQDGEDGDEETVVSVVNEAFRKLREDGEPVGEYRIWGEGEEEDEERMDMDSVQNKISQSLLRLEGKMETLLMELPQYESLLEVVENSYRKLLEPMMLDKLFQRIAVAQRLLATSTFADIEVTEKSEPIKQEDLDRVSKEFLDEMSDFLSAGNRYQNRAVIAAVLKELPVFFSSRSDVMNYVRSSLAGCRNMPEKAASLELLKELFGEFAQ